MKKFTDVDWKKIRSDLGQGFEKSMSAVKNSAIVAGKKAEELAEEGQRQFRVMVLKSKVKDSLMELGVRVHSLMGRHSRNQVNPVLDKKVKEVVTKIRKYESQIMALEKEHRTAPRAAKKRRPTFEKKAA